MSPREHHRLVARIEPCLCGIRIVAKSERDLDIERAVRLHNEHPRHRRFLDAWEREVRESVRVEPAPPFERYAPLPQRRDELRRVA